MSCSNGYYLYRIASTRRYCAETRRNAGLFSLFDFFCLDGVSVMEEFLAWWAMWICSIWRCSWRRAVLS